MGIPKRHDIKRRHRELKQLGGRLSQALSEKALTQNQLAKTLDVSRASVAKWVSGEQTMDVVRLMDIASICEKPLPWFFGALDDREAELEVRLKRAEDKIKGAFQLLGQIAIPGGDIEKEIGRLMQRAEAMSLFVESLQEDL